MHKIRVNRIHNMVGNCGFRLECLQNKGGILSCFRFLFYLFAYR